MNQLPSISMRPDEKIVAPEEQTTTPADASVDRVEPPKVYLPACGALVDIFWWARRTPDAPK
ncbi:MAG TPA: hypothetical protein VLI44_05315 [Sporolactobacillaceae bacterium]|nr:hypothetical protein [Sporolactobacillaceae bacterium]